MTVLLLVLNSCTSCPKSEKIYLNWQSVPDSYFNGENVVKVNKETHTTSMPNWYWIKICEYINDSEKNKDILTELNLINLTE